MNGNMQWAIGSYLCAVTERGVALVAENNKDIVVDLWKRLNTAEDFSSIVNSLAVKYESDLAQLPEFALLVIDSATLQIAARGEIEVFVKTTVSEDSVTGSGVFTWVENSFESVLKFQIVAGQAKDNWYPIKNGVGNASAVAWELDHVLAEDLCAVPQQTNPISKQVDQLSEGNAIPEAEINSEVNDVMDAPSTFADEISAASHKTAGELANNAPEQSPDVPQPAEPELAQWWLNFQEEPENIQPDTSSNNDSFLKEDSLDQVPEGLANIIGAESMTVPLSSENIDSLQDKNKVNLVPNIEPNPVAATAGIIAEENLAPVKKSQVLAGFCPQGHPNAPYKSNCRLCGQPLTGQTANIDPPVLGRMRFSTGQIVNLDTNLVIGRAPVFVPETGEKEPHLISVLSPHRQISRTHCEVKIDGWETHLVDKKSNNGTFLLRDGQNPIRLKHGVPILLQYGDVVNLGEEVTMTFEAI